jgi:oligopeptidase B
MKSYSPYDNIEAKAYPHMLVTAGLNDPRVAYWEPAKWTARLRARKTDSNRLLLKTHMGAGHGGASGRYDALRELAFKYAFLLDTIGAG